MRKESISSSKILLLLYVSKIISRYSKCILRTNLSLCPSSIASVARTAFSTRSWQLHKNQVIEEWIQLYFCLIFQVFSFPSVLFFSNFFKRYKCECKKRERPDCDHAGKHVRIFWGNETFACKRRLLRGLEGRGLASSWKLQFKCKEKSSKDHVCLEKLFGKKKISCHFSLISFSLVGLVSITLFILGSSTC